MSELIERRCGEMTTYDTRSEANEKVDRAKRYRQILHVLENFGDCTAKEVAVILYKTGYIPTSERNFTAPRLTELYHKGVVDVIGKEKCAYTGKTVAVYSIRDKEALV